MYTNRVFLNVRRLFKGAYYSRCGVYLRKYGKSKSIVQILLGHDQVVFIERCSLDLRQVSLKFKGAAFASARAVIVGRNS